MSLFWFQLINELKKMFARKRTYIGFGIFILVDILVLFFANLPKPRNYFRHMIEQNGYAFDQYFSGLTLAFLMIIWPFILETLFIALVAGDVVAKEVEDGTLRMTLCRPISRLRIIALKYISCVIYTFAFVLFIGTIALIAGGLYKGWGGLFVFEPMANVFALYEKGPGLIRYFCALPLLAISFTSIASLGLMFSCFNVKPATATILTLTVILLDFIFRNIPVFESLRPWFITTHMAAWLQVFLPHVPWPRLIEHYTYLLAFDATFVVIGLAAFQNRDFKA